MARRHSALLALIVVCVSACGSGSSSDSEPSVPTQESTPVTAPVRESEPQGADAILVAALQAVQGRDEYTLRSWIAQDIDFALLGLDTSSDLDPSEPFSVIEVASNQRTVSLDLDPAFRPLTGVSGLEIQMWVQDDRIVIDTTPLEPLADLGPDVLNSIGPMRPGVAFVDLADGGVDADRIASAIGGPPPLTMERLAADLPSALDDLKVVDSQTLAGTAPYPDVYNALGADVEEAAFIAASSMAQATGVSADDLVGLYLTFYSGLVVDVTVEIDEQGAFHALEIEADFSGIWDLIFSDENAGLFGLTSDDVELIASEVKSATFDVTFRYEFDLNTPIGTAAVPDALVDRTDEWIQYVTAMGY